MTSLSTPLEGAQAVDRRMDTGLLSRLQAFAWPLGLAGILLALVAQLLFDQRIIPDPLADKMPLWLALLAALLFGVASRSIALEAESEVVPFRAPSRLRLALLALGLLLCFVSMVGFRDNLIDPPELILWLTGLAVALAAAWPEGPKSEDPRPRLPVLRPPPSVVLSWSQLALLAILLVGAVYRFYDLHELPAEMNGDLFENYQDVRSVLNGLHSVFFPANQGREPMLFYIAAPIARIFGVSHYTLKLTTVLIGLATIPLLYLLGRELFNREVGLVAALWLAVSRWHVSLSRSGISFVLLLLLVIVVMLALIRALRSGRALDYALLGIALGLGLYTYKPGPFIIPATVLSALLIAWRRRCVRATLGGLALTLAVTFAVWAPLLAYAASDWAHFTLRLNVQTSIMREAYAQEAAPLLTAVRMVGRSLAMYNLIGDANGTFNPPYVRHLGFAAGALLLAGAGTLLARLWRGFNLIMLVFFAVMLVPLVTAMIPPGQWGNVSFGLGTMAPVLIAAALPVVALQRMAALPGPGWRLEFALVDGGQTVWSLTSGLRRLGVIVTAAILAFVIVAEARDGWLTFFYDYRQGLPARNFALERTMAEVIAEFSESGMAYIRGVPYWYNGTTVRARLESEHNIQNDPTIEVPVPSDQIPAMLPAGRVLVILNPEDQESLAVLRAAIPRHIVLERHDYEGNIAFLMFVGER